MEDIQMAQMTQYYDSLTEIRDEIQVAVVGTHPPAQSTSEKSRVFSPRFRSLIEASLEGINGGIYLTTFSKTPQKPGNTLTKSEVEACKKELLAELSVVKPKFLLLFGGEPASILPGFHNLMEDHGSYFYLQELKAIAVPTFHPTSFSGSPELLSYFLHDIERFHYVYKNPESGVPKSLSSTLLIPETFEELSIQLLEIRKELCSDCIILDTETQGLYGRLELVGLRDPVNQSSWIIQIGPDKDEDAFLHTFSHFSDLTIIGHNLVYDLSILRYLSPHRVIDTMIAAHYLGEEGLSLKHLAKKYSLNHPGSHTASGLRYLELDLEATEILYRQFAKIVPNPMYQKLMHWVLITVHTFLAGIRIDPVRLATLLQEERNRLEEMRKQFPINPASTTQVVQWLLQSHVPLDEKTEKGAYSVSESVLLKLEEYPQVQQLLEYRAASKQLSFIQSYIELGQNGYVHPRLKITGTATGRFSCEEPNLQQVPRSGPLKSIFIPRYDYIGLMDLSQAELRIAAMITQDSTLSAALETGDPHREIAAALFRKRPEDVTSAERKASKKTTFGLLYGGSIQGLAKRNHGEAELIRQVQSTFREQMPSLWSWIQSREYSSNQIVTMFKRTRDISSIALTDPSAAVRRKINTPIQSAASDCLLWIGATADETFCSLGMRTRVYFPIHDSIYLDIPADEIEEVIRILGQAFRNLKEEGPKPIRESKLPIIGEGTFGKSWSRCESTNEEYSPEVSVKFSTHVINGILSVERRSQE